MHKTLSNIPDEINALAETMNMEVKRAAERMIAESPGRDNPFIKSIYDRIYNYLTDGGKRAHAQAVLLAYQAVGGKNIDAILPVAAGFQLYHHYAMVHDDVYDDDKQRRNRPTDHEVFRQWFAQQGNAHDRHHFEKPARNPLFTGNAERKAAVSALVYGKIVHAFGFEAILSAPFEKEQLYTVIKLLNWHDVYDNVGQMRDVLLEGETVTDVEECLKTAYLKTGREFQACTTAGALLAGASQSQIDALNEWASCFGMAYQLQDDLEDIEPDSEKGLGRGVGADIVARKPTFLAITALQLAQGETKEELTRWLNYVGTQEVDVPAVMKAIIDSGAVDACRAKVAELLEQGCAALNNALPALDPEAVAKIELCTAYFLSRGYWKRAMPSAVAALTTV